MTTDDRLVSGASSLNPNKSSGDIGELKPCPFCKGFAKIVGLQADQEYGLIKCAGCDLTTDIMPSREELLSFWNTRTSDPESAAEIERLRRELADAKLVLTDPAAFHLHALRNNVLSRMNALHIACATDYDSLKARALTAESALAAAWEEAAKIAEAKALEFLSPEYATGQPLSSFNERFACEQVASAIRAAVSKKTAESGHSPSTHKSESK